MERKYKIFLALVIVGYILGILLGYPVLKEQKIRKEYCVQVVGPISCQPDEDCDRECLKYDYKYETREREAFYTYGPLGAFIGGWLSVLAITFVLKE